MMIDCPRCGGDVADDVACPTCDGHGFVIDLGPAELEHALSKTQLEAFRGCERKFGWQYLEGVEKSNKYAQLGIEVHAELEAWLRSGTLPNPVKDAGKIAESSLHLLPPPTTPGLLVESEVFTIDQTAMYHGFADWIEPPGTDMPAIGDHKSTGSFQWAMKPEDLDQDIQASIYARAAMDYFEVDEIRAKWHYLRTKGAAKCHPVHRVLTRKRVEQTFDEIISPIAVQVQEAWRVRLPVLEMKPNYRACGDFGGCAYRANCGVGAKERYMTLIAGKTSSLAEKIAAAAKAKEEAAASGTAAPSTGTTAAPKQPDLPAINPPAPKAASTALKQRMTALAAETAAKAAAKEETATPAAVVAAKEALEAVAAATPAALVAATTPPAAKADLPPGPVVAPSVAGLVLLAGCFPVFGAEVVQAADYIARAKLLIESELGLRDYRLAEFGRGPAMLCAATRQMLADEPPPSGSFVFLDNRSPEGRDTYDAFREVATVIIRGF